MIKKIFATTMLFLVVLVVSGCSSIDSIKIGGDYTGDDGTTVGGEIEIVLAKDLSKSIGMPVFTSSDGTKFVLISEKNAQRIVEKIEPAKKEIENYPILKRLKNVVSN